MKKQKTYLIRALFMVITIALALSACGGAGGGPVPEPKGTLEVIVSGLSNVDADITVTGPDAYSANITETTELTGLAPGMYELTAQPVAGHAVMDTMPIMVAVEAGKIAKATVVYEFIGVNLTLSAPDIVSFSETAVVTVSIERFGLFSGEIRLAPTVPGTFDCLVLGSSCAAEQVILASEDSISYAFIDDGTTPIGTYEFRINSEHELDGETIAQEFVFDIEVAPVVTTADDATPAEPGMLRYLVAEARTESETIIFLPNVFASATEIILIEEIAIEQRLSIDGLLDEDGNPLVALDGNNAVNVLRITADATVQNLGIQHGVRDLGAGVFVGPAANVTLENTRIIGNTASVSGGGVYSLGDLTIIDSDIVGNTAQEHGGGIAVMPGGELDITGAVIADNTVLSQSGGGLYIGPGPGSQPIPVTIDTTFIKQNSAPSGGGIVSFGDVTIEASEITHNQASLGDGGGISNHYRMEITGSLIESNNAVSGGGLFNDGYVGINKSTISKNGASEDGGGVYNGVIDSDRHVDGFTKYATIGTSIITGNHAEGSGGGIFSVRRLDIANTQIEDNVADIDGGGIYTVSVPHTAATNNNGGQFTFVASTVANNMTVGRGGGIYAGTDNVGGSQQPIPEGEFVMRNALVYGNIASQAGGGIYLSGANTTEATIFFTTIMDNSSGNEGAGLYVAGRGNVPNAGLRYRGNLFLDNTVGSNARDFYSTFTTVTSKGYNSFTDIDSSDGESSKLNNIVGNRFEVAPELYGKYGGTLIGHNQEMMSSVKITPASAVAYQVPIAECVNHQGQPLSSDMTGMPRVYGNPDFCTIGSFEARD